MSGLCFFDAPTCKNRAGHSRVDNGMPTRLEPCAKKCNVRGPPNTVGAFNNNQLAAIFFLFDAR